MRRPAESAWEAALRTDRSVPAIARSASTRPRPAPRDRDLVRAGVRALWRLYAVRRRATLVAMTRDPSSTSPNAPDPRGVFSRARIASACLRFSRTHAVLLVSALAAAATMLVVPPDASYLGYFDLKTLACLFGILALVGALRNAGVFEATARAMVARFSTCRAAVAAIVGITLVLSMIATNDMALIMMLPLCAATLLKAGWERALPFAFIMQSLAANLGGMIVPFGNPQNLYLFERFDIPLTDFLATMALPFAVSGAAHRPELRPVREADAPRFRRAVLRRGGTSRDPTSPLSTVVAPSRSARCFWWSSPRCFAWFRIRFRSSPW